MTHRSAPAGSLRLETHESREKRRDDARARSEAPGAPSLSGGSGATRTASTECWCQIHDTLAAFIVLCRSTFIEIYSKHATLIALYSSVQLALARHAMIRRAVTIVLAVAAMSGVSSGSATDCTSGKSLRELGHEATVIWFGTVIKAKGVGYELADGTISKTGPVLGVTYVGNVERLDLR